MTHAYTYTTLRYVHDIATGEYVNVGVALHSPSAHFTGALLRTTFGRLVAMFPGTNGEYFRRIMRQVRAEFDAIADRSQPNLPLNPPANIMEIARTILPQDDSSLQWGPMAAGLTDSPSLELESLFERLVSRYDEKKSRAQKSDEDVWRSFKKTLEQKQILHRFGEKKISVKDDEIEFAHAWKNGVWHCIEPISFDLGSEDSIRDKAHRWLGQIASVRESEEKFRLYLVLGAPQDPNLAEAYANAKSILGKIPVEKYLVEETDAASVSSELAKEIDEHDSRG